MIDLLKINQQPTKDPEENTPNILQIANQSIEQVAKSGLNIGMQGLQWVGDRMEDIDKSVNLRTITGLPSDQDYTAAGMTPQPEPKWLSPILDYSVHDARGHLAGGVGNVAGFGSKFLGANQQQSEKINDAAEFLAQLAIPQTADLALGAGYYKRVLTKAPELGRLAIKAGDALNNKAWRGLDNLFNPQLAIAGIPGATSRAIPDIAKAGKLDNVLKIDPGATAAGGGLAARGASSVVDSSKLNQNVATVSDELNFLPKDVNLTSRLQETTEIQDYAKLKIQHKVQTGKGDLGVIDSAQSTLGDVSEMLDDPRVYNSPKFKKLLQKVESQIEGAPALEWHHKNMKALTSPFVQKMNELIELGLATEADRLNLAYISYNRGVGMGDRLSGLVQMPRVVHQELHKLMRQVGIEPTGKFLSQYKIDISNINNVNDLTRAFVKQINDVSGPMTKEAHLLNSAYKGIDERLLEKFSGLTVERNTINQLLSKVKGTKKNKQGLFSNNPTVVEMAKKRIIELEAKLKDINTKRKPVKLQVIEELKSYRGSSPERNLQINPIPKHLL